MTNIFFNIIFAFIIKMEKQDAILQSLKNKEELNSIELQK